MIKNSSCITHQLSSSPCTLHNHSQLSWFFRKLQPRNLHWDSWTGFACPSPLLSIPCRDLDLIHVNMQRVWVSSAWSLGSKRQGKLCIVIRAQKPHTFTEPSKLPRPHSEVPYNHLEQSRRMGLGSTTTVTWGVDLIESKVSDTWPSHLSRKTLIISFDHVDSLHSSSQDLWSLRL